MPSVAAGVRWRWAAAVAGAALVLCLAAFLNGGPILFPDTGVYLFDGQQLVRFTTPINMRPVFYGLAVWFLHLERSTWPILLAQGLIIAHLIALVLRAVGGRPGPWPYLGLIAGLVILTPVSWYVAHILPDIFASVLILALFLLGLCRDRISRLETVYLFMLATASICFHLSHVLIAASFAAVGCAIWLIWRRSRTLLRPLLLIGPLLTALLGYFSFSFALYHQVTLTPRSPPHLLAHVIADGPGRDYLRQHCADDEYYGNYPVDVTRHKM